MDGGGGSCPRRFKKWVISLVIVEPHGDQTFQPYGNADFDPEVSKSASHKAKGAYSDLKFTSLKAHP